jgi:SAM-dependent methyltransferase
MRKALAGKRYARAALALFVELLRAEGGGPVADVGCGPGHVTAHLHDSGLDAFGIDLSPVMIDIARREHPGLRFEVGFHVGQTSGLKTEGYGGHPMKVYVHRRQPAFVAAALPDAGFAVEAHMLLDPDGSLPEAMRTRGYPVRDVPFNPLSGAGRRRAGVGLP